MMDLKTASSQEIASYFSHEVNNLFFKPDKIAEEQKDSRQMKELDICWIKILSSPAYRIDLRNEASAKTGRQLAGISFVKREMEHTDNQRMEDVAKTLSFYALASFFFSSVSVLNFTSTEPYFSLM